MKINFVSKSPYAEEGQPNPIRWAILSTTDGNTFKNESAWLKCKDFLNDYCVAYNGGPRFAIYGFSTEGMSIPKKGESVYVAVKELTTSFLDNLKMLNKMLPAPIVEHSLADGIVILDMPPLFWKNTYNISLITLMIRLCNVEHKFASFEEFKKYKLFAQKDQMKWDQVAAKNMFFDIPKKFDEYVWYAGPNYNDKKECPTYQLASLVHNGGVLSWSKFF